MNLTTWITGLLLFGIRIGYVFSFPLNFGGDASIYYTMLVERHSSLLMASGYPFLMMVPYHFFRWVTSLLWTIPRDPCFTPWWQSEGMRGDIVGSEKLLTDFSWAAFFQDHGFLIFQHFIACLAIVCIYLLVRKYFGFSVAILTAILLGLSPLGLEWPSSSLPEWLQGAGVAFWVFLADKAKEENAKRWIYYPLLGATALLTVLIKFNAVPVFLVLFIGLLIWDQASLLKKVAAVLLSTVAGLCVVACFLFGFHYPTTGSYALSMNKWPLADKVFQILPHLSVREGEKTKRVIALLSQLPKSNPNVLSPAAYFRSVHAADGERIGYRNQGLWLMGTSSEELDQYLKTGSFSPVFGQSPMLRIAYYVGLKEYNDLLQGIYRETVFHHPFLFLQDTAHRFMRDFGLRQNSYEFRPRREDVNEESQPARYGYVKFQWPSEKYVCYHENGAWLPGVIFFSNWQSYWPPTWVFWLFAFAAFAFSLKNRKSTQDGLVIFFFILCIGFVWVSNMAWSFRLKEFECIRWICTFLASIGMVGCYRFAKSKLRMYLFQWKKRQLRME